MLWFKHFSNFRNRPVMRNIIRELGEVGYARAVRLIETACDVGGSGVMWNGGIIALQPPTDTLWLAEELGMPADELESTLDVFARAGFISFEPSRNDEEGTHPALLEIKQIDDWRDEWTARVAAKPELGKVKKPKRTGGIRTPD